MRKWKIELRRDRLVLTEEIEGFFEKVVTKFGNGGGKWAAQGT